MRITIPAGITTKSQLMDAFRRQLGCPWFGGNWDALSDALRDLSWCGDESVEIVHEAWPFAPGRRSEAIYREILDEAVRSWEDDAPGRLVVRGPGDGDGDGEEIPGERGA